MFKPLLIFTTLILASSAYAKEPSSFSVFKSQLDEVVPRILEEHKSERQSQTEDGYYERRGAGLNRECLKNVHALALGSA